MKTYTKQELETKKLSELKEIAYALDVEPLDDARKKANWIREILTVMPKKVEKVEAKEAPLVKLSELQAGDIVCAPSDAKHEQPLEVVAVFTDCLKVKGEGKEFKLSAPSDTEVVLIKREAFNWSNWKIDPVKTRTVNASEDGKRKIEISNFVEKPKVKTCADCPLFKPFGDGSGRGLCCGTDSVARAHHGQTGDCLHLIKQHQEESEKTIEIVVTEWDANGITSVVNTYEITLEAENWMRQSLIYKSGLEWRITNLEGMTTEIIYRRLIDAVNARVQLLSKVPRHREKPDSEYTLEFIGKTDLMIGYNVRRLGLLIKSIFQVGDTWQCGDGRFYPNSHSCIEALESLTEVTDVRIAA